MAKRPPNINAIEVVLLGGFSFAINVLRFALAAVPVVDIPGEVIDRVLWFLEWFSTNLYFLLRTGGFSFLAGSKSRQKIALTIATTVIGAMPFLGDFTFDTTIDVLGMFYLMRKEYQEYAAQQPAVR